MSYLLDYNPGTQQWGYPRRGGVQLSGTIIVHTAECAADNDGEDLSAEGCASMIANRADWGSYHRLVDSDSIIDMLPWEYEAWQDTETNNWAVGISAALRTSDWLTMPADRRDKVYRNLAACAADFVQYMATKGVTVPLRRITGAQARARVPGFCAHGDSGVARTDPGADFDWALFFAYTAAALTGSLSYAAESIKILTEEIDVAAEENIMARLAQIVEWQDGKFREVQEAEDRNRNLLAGWVRDVVAAKDTITPEQIDAKFKELTAATKPEGQVLFKGDADPTVYAWDASTGFRGIGYDEYLTLTLAGATLKELPQPIIDTAVGGK